MPCRTREKNVNKELHSTKELELRYQKSIHQMEIISKDEESRRLRVCRHVEGHDMETLRSQLAIKDGELEELLSNLKQAQSEASYERELHVKTQNLFKARTRELSCLKAEFDAMVVTAEGSAQVISEKLSLTRELNALKPEVEHLRCQLVHHQSVIAEKLSLERQLSTAEVELTAERKARQEAVKRDDYNRQVQDDLRRMLREAERKIATEKKERVRLESATDTHLTCMSDVEHSSHKLQELEKQLLVERRDKDKISREAEASRAEAQAKIEMLQKRLDAVKAKLRVVQADRKHFDPDLSSARHLQHVGRDAALRTGTVKQSRGKKRAASEMDAAATLIDSPDMNNLNDRKTAKKRAAEQSLAGEKSLFSVTPFLSRNKTISLDALPEEEEEVEVSHINQDSRASELPLVGPGAENRALSPQKAGSGKQVKAKKETQKIARPRGRPKKVLAESSPNIIMPMTQTVKANLTSTGISTSLVEKSDSPTSGPTTTTSTLAQEVVDARVIIPGLDTTGSVCDDSYQSRPQDLDLKKKKRRLATDVSKTIFDEPEIEIPATKAKRPGKVQLSGPGRAAFVSKKAGAARHVFGGSSFSPLKKDRRGVGASFLV